MANSLLDVVEVGVNGAVSDVAALPVRESVRKQEVHAALEKSVRGAVGKLVPRVGSADLGARECLLDVVDLVEQLVAGQTAAVEGLGADGHGVDLVLVLRHVLGERTLVGLEAGVDICISRFPSASPPPPS